MIFSTKNLISTSLVLLISAPAFAGTSLSSLLGGDSLTSNNGKLVFSDFKFTPNSNAPSATDIEIMTLDSGLLFGSPIFTDSTTGIIDYGVAYKATAVGSEIVSALMESKGSYTGDGFASAYKLIENANGEEIAQLTSIFSASESSSGGSEAFAGQSSVFISDSFSGSIGSNGSAELNSVEQTFETLDPEAEVAQSSAPTAAPSPTAALGGLALLGLAGMRRRRG